MEKEPYIQSNAGSFIQGMRKKANRIIKKKANTQWARTIWRWWWGVTNKSDKLEPHWYITHTYTQTKPKRNRRRWRRQPNHPDRGEKAAGCRHQSDRWDRHHHGHFADNQERRLIYSQRDHSAWSCIPVPKILLGERCSISPWTSSSSFSFSRFFSPFFFFTKRLLMKTHLSTLYPRETHV